MDIQTQVIDIVAKGLSKKKDDVKPELRLKDDLGADSLDVVELVMELEDAFEITIPDDVMQQGKIQTIGDIVNYVAEKKK